ncbi:MAG: DUF2804 domain-containing protein [bacterium]|nr:DUF2804 domain-containing protein [bacterium]
MSDRIKTEITTTTDLVLPNGKLNPASIGWSKTPQHNCNVTGRWPRKKRWDYWCVTGPDFLFSVTIADVDYALSGFVYFLDYKSKRFIEHTVVIPLPKSYHMPQSPQGALKLAHKELELEFITDANGATELRATSDHFGGHKLDARIQIQREKNQESLNVVIPWSDRKYQFTSKQPGLPATGSVQIDGETFDFPKGTSFACLDYGRGVWPFSSVWNWSSFSVKNGRDVIGVNLGGKWTDGTGINENAVFLNGKVYKIFDDLIFDYNPADFMQPWRIHAPDPEELDLRFTPFFERKAETNLLLIFTRVNQMIGRFEGGFRAGDKTVKISDKTQAIGWAEEHEARW